MLKVLRVFDKPHSYTNKCSTELIGTLNDDALTKGGATILSSMSVGEQSVFPNVAANATALIAHILGSRTANAFGETGVFRDAVINCVTTCIKWLYQNVTIEDGLQMKLHNDTSESVQLLALDKQMEVRVLPTVQSPIMLIVRPAEPEDMHMHSPGNLQESHFEPLQGHGKTYRVPERECRKEVRGIVL